jgi:hypothetical protein
MNLDEYFIGANVVCTWFKYALLVLKRSLKAVLAVKDPLPAHLSNFSATVEHNEDYACQSTCDARLYIIFVCLVRL